MVKELRIIGVDGRLLDKQTNLGLRYIWDIPETLNGILIYELSHENGKVSVGKLVIE